MTSAHLTETKRGFGGDSYTYQADGKTIVCSLGFGLMCPPRITLNVDTTQLEEKYTTYGDWSDMIEQGKNFLREHGYEPDDIPILT